MSNSFEGARVFTEVMYPDCDKSMLDRLQRAHEHDMEHMRKASFHEGYVAGQRSMDADHAAVAMRLRGLEFDGGSHENLNKIAYAIYPCATGWACDSCEGLRDKIIDLMGGVHDGISDCVCGGACADGCRDDHGQSEAVDVDDTVSGVRADVPAADGVADSAAAGLTYDVLGNERHKAVCELRNVRDNMSDNMADNVSRIIYAIDARPKVDERACEAIADRLIHLLGGDEPYSNLTRTILEPNLPKSAETIKSVGECDGKIMENGENHKIATIADELREWASTKVPYKYSHQLHAIADRIDEQFNHAMISRSSELGCYKMRINQLEQERDKLIAEVKSLKRAAERDADQMEALNLSLEEVTAERDELQEHLRTAELGCDANHRLAEANARWCDELLDLLRDAREEYMNAHALCDELRYQREELMRKWMHERAERRELQGRLECTFREIESTQHERDELQAKLDAIREELDE